MSREWKGNKNAVSTLIGFSTSWHPEQRAAGDYYTTDPTAVEDFMKCMYAFGATLLSGEKVAYYLAPESHGVWWEPACGCGNISKVLEGIGIPVVSTDLYDRGYGTPGVDFLQTTEVPEGCKNIITNPPYSLASEFILHAMDILPEDGNLYVLLNISYLTGQKRFKDIYSHQYLRRVYIYPYRINCYKNNEDIGHSSPVNYAWYVFSKKRDRLLDFTICRQEHPLIFWIEKRRLVQYEGEMIAQIKEATEQQRCITTNFVSK